MLTFDKFRNTRQVLGTKVAEKVLELDGQIGPNTVWVEAYAGHRGWCERTSGGLYLATIGNESRIGRRDDISAFLYFEHYCREYVHDGTSLAELTRMLEDYCDFIGIQRQCAQDLQAIVADWKADAYTHDWFHWRRVVSWLSWFIDMWDDISDQEEQAMRDPTYRAKMRSWDGKYIPGGMKFAP